MAATALHVLLGQGLPACLPLDCLASCRALGYEWAQESLLVQSGASQISVSLQDPVSSWQAASVENEVDSTKWKEIASILDFYKVGVYCGTYTVASIVKQATSSSACTARTSVRQLPFELAALARKDRGNILFKDAVLEEALGAYTRALIILGLATAPKRPKCGDDDDGDVGIDAGAGNSSPSQPKKQKNDPLQSVTVRRSLDLSMALYSNRSLCFLKLGRTLPAIDDANAAIARMPCKGDRPINIQAWTKAKHRLASALTRAALFKDAVAHLDAIDKLNKGTGQSFTAALRKYIKQLCSICSPRSADCKTLFEHLKTQRESLSREILAAPPEERWFVVRQQFCKVPMLFLLDMPEVRKLSRKFPGKMLNMMAMVSRAQDPQNPCNAFSGIGRRYPCANMMKLRSMIENVYAQTNNERKRREHFRELATSWGALGVDHQGFLEEMGQDVLDSEDEMHPDFEEVHQELILLVRWVLAYIELDALDWDSARETLHRLIFHLTVHPDAPMYWPDHINSMKSPERKDFKNPYVGTQELNIVPFPRWYLAEVMHLLALCEFGRGDTQACRRAIETYHELVPESFLDRNWESAIYLRAWPQIKLLREQGKQILKEARAEEVQNQCNRARKKLSATYAKEYEAVYADDAWVEARFYHDLGLELPGNWPDLASAFEKQRAFRTGMPKDLGESSADRFDDFVGRAIGVTTRFHMSPKEKARTKDRSEAGAFANTSPWGMGMRDMENDMYEIQQNMLNSVFTGGLGGGFGGQFGGAHEGSEDSEEEDDDEDEADEESMFE